MILQGLRAVALATALFLSAAGAAHAADGGSQSIPGKVGDTAPSMILKDPKGAEHDITLPLAKDGRVLIYFWSVFCSNCKEAMPLLLDLESRWRERGLTIWAVNVDGDRFSNAVDAFLADANLPFPVVYDTLKGDLLVAADPLSVTKTPSLFVLARDKTIKVRQEIVIDMAAVEKSLKESD